MQWIIIHFEQNRLKTIDNTFDVSCYDMHTNHSTMQQLMNFVYIWQKYCGENKSKYYSDNKINNSAK